MKILRSFTLACLLPGLAACASASASTSAQPDYVRYVVERDMVVHQSANAGADSVGRLPVGTALTAWVEDVGGNWYRLHSENGNVGYIFGKPFRRAE